MSEATWDVLGIGNAIVDVVSRATDEFIENEGIIRDAMNLIDEARANELYEKMGPGIECSGGSVANSIAGIGLLGGRGAYIGKVRDDQLGQIFAHDMKQSGIEFRSPKASEGPSTARCLVLVSDDGTRSMNTYLGACVGLGPDDIDEELVAQSEVTYLEGYLWDPEEAKEAFRKAMRLAHKHGREVALTLSDPFCVERHREEFRGLVEGDVDILFANEDEVMSLYQVDTFDEALQAVQGKCRVAALTRSEKGAVIVSADEVHVVDAAPVDKVVDTTGAGDLYSAGFLYGLTHKRELGDCGRIASICAAEIISHFGARPEADIRKLVIEADLMPGEKA